MRVLTMDLPYYHGPLSKRDCETLLLKEGVDGNFLLRDSESMPGVLCLCVSFKKLVYTYRIFKEKHGYYNIQRTAIMWMSCLEDKETGQSTYRRDGVIALTSDPASPAGVDL
ncbi:SH2 domain-containing protein 1B isoform X3 [Neophocaena asiaeorientalis asiaeorientalis]|uniref:SH2 domain-containing protein 1B isoform X3 n=1 Tax=Neophocaena asiaeorientalis asiaeorientalis TaxID=1706337 RepID=A0A341BXQ4_NEOAA|nr:SH2 domain-containing protein 1B isoform X3 [Neophocaena asiaeorientalis asiaeorientalis]